MLMATHYRTLRQEFSKVMATQLATISKKNMPPKFVQIAESWCAAEYDETSDACVSVLDHGLRWAAHVLAAPGALEISVLRALGRLGALLPVKAHLIDVVLAAVVQNRLDDTRALDFVEALASRAQMKVK